MKKKILVLFLTIALVFLVVGCQKNEESTTSESSDNEQKVEKKSKDDSTSENNEAIRLGRYGPLTGPISNAGNAASNGVKLAVEQINESGGIDGRKINVIEYDDKSSPELAVKNVTRLISADKVHCIVGSLHSGNILASGPVIEEAKIPEVGIGTSPIWLQKGYKYLFRSLPNSSWGNIMLVETMQELGIEKIGILTRLDEYAKVGTEDLLKRIEEAGNPVEVVAKESFQPGDTDFTGQMTKLIHSGAEAMVLYATQDDTPIGMKQFRQLGYEGYVFGPEALGAPEVIDVAGESANGAISVAAYNIPKNPEDAPSERERTFLNNYKEKYGEMPKSDTAYRAYDAVRILERGIKDAGSLDGTEIRDALENITDLEGLAGTFNFKGNHGEGLDKTRVFITYKGKNILIEDYLKLK